MKKFITALAVSLALITTTAFATENPGTNPALVTFENTFKGAQDVKWSEVNDAISASFVLGGTRVVAYFNQAGELLGTARNILYNQLPLVVITEINRRYSTASVYDFTEFTTGTETFYIMTADYPTKTLKLRASANGDISVEKKTKK